MFVVIHKVCVNNSIQKFLQIVIPVIQVEKLQKLEGPVYNTDAVKHQFNEITQRMETIKNITYPCVQDDHKHHFNEIQKSLDTVKNLVGPVYETEHKTLFAEVEKKAESLKNLAGEQHFV